jgi:hypothetical protein
MAIELASGTRINRVAGTALLISAAVTVVGVVCLIAMFVGFAAGAASTARAFGFVNDASALLTYPLTLPAMVVLHGLLRPRWRGASTVAAAFGVVGVVGIVLLQALLVANVLTFEQQIGPVSVAFVLFGVWAVSTGYMASGIGLLPHGVRLGLIASLYVGFPVWAWLLGRRLQQA